jgi:malate synthase
MILRALSRSSRPQPRWLSSLREAERAPSVVLIGPPVEKECQKAIVSTEALAFIDLLSRQFDDRRRELVAQRTNPRLAYDAKTADLRDSEWQVHVSSIER